MNVDQNIFKDWLANLPKDFPEVFEHENIYHNPFIQCQKEYTLKAVYEGLKFLEEIALPWHDNESFALGKDATWGYIYLLQCLSQAIEFETTHRKDDKFETAQDNEQPD